MEINMCQPEDANICQRCGRSEKEFELFLVPQKLCRDCRSVPFLMDANNAIRLSLFQTQLAEKEKMLERAVRVLKWSSERFKDWDADLAAYQQVEQALAEIGEGK